LTLHARRAEASERDPSQVRLSPSPVRLSTTPVPRAGISGLRRRRRDHRAQHGTVTCHCQWDSSTALPALRSAATAAPRLPSQTCTPLSAGSGGVCTSPDCQPAVSPSDTWMQQPELEIDLVKNRPKQTGESRVTGAVPPIRFLTGTCLMLQG